MDYPKPIEPSRGPTRITPAPTSRVLPARPAGLTSTPDALTLLKALRRRWPLALGLGLVAAGIVGVAVWSLVPQAKYTAVAAIRVASVPKRIMFKTQDSSADFATYQRTQVALLNSRYILGAALNNPEVSQLETIQEQQAIGDSVEWLGENLRASFLGGSEVLQVSLSGDRPEDLAAIVNAVVASFLELVPAFEKEDRKERLKILRELWGRYQEDLEIKRKALKELAKAVGSHDQNVLAIAHQFKVAQLDMAQKEHMRVQAELLRAEAELAVQQAGRTARPTAPVSSGPEVDALVEQDPQVIGLRRQMDESARKYWEVARIARKNDPAMVVLQRQWATSKKALEELRGQRRRAIGEDLRRQAQGGDLVQLARLQAQIGVQKAYQKTLAQGIDGLQKELERINENGPDLEADREEIAIATDIARKVGAEVEALLVEEKAPERMKMLAEARVPGIRDELRKIKAGGGAAMGVFVAVLLSVSFWEFLARRVDTPDEVVQGLGLRIVGALPAVPSRSLRSSPRNALNQSRWRSLLVESVDATRTMLLHASRTDSVRVVMVTSAVKGEGKTSLACHLSTSLARAGRHTLLVDCDLRSPATHRLFDLPVGPGVCEVLRHEVDLDGVIGLTSIAGLDLIPAGRCDPSALQALAQDDLRPIFDELKTRYDFIVVDSAPVLPVADSLLVGQNVDAVIFSILRDVSRLPQVYAAHERLTRLGAKFLGAVVNGVQGHDYCSEYYYTSMPR